MANDLVGQIMRFGAVGSVGFAIDGGLLWALTSNGTDAYVARLFSFPVAVVSTWLLNRNWTFRATRHPHARTRQFGRYFSVKIFGSLTNYAIYATWIALAGASQIMIMAGFVMGSAVGLVLNFIGARYFVFQPASSAPVSSNKAGPDDSDPDI